MSRQPLLLSILLATLAAACSGGSSTVVITPPPATGNFSNADLRGQYAFSMTGTEICAGFSSFFGRIGSLTADGNGHISGGVEDVNTCTGVQTLQFTSSTYSIQADGRGTLTLTNSTGTTNTASLCPPARRATSFRRTPLRRPVAPSRSRTPPPFPSPELPVAMYSTFPA